MRKSYIFGSMLMLSGFVHGQASDVTICQGTSLRLKAESAGANSYEWYRNNQVIPGAAGNILMVSEEGTYRAFALIDNGCKSDASISVSVQFRAPVAANDMVFGKANTELILDLLQNDVSLCSPVNAASVTVYRRPLHGKVENTSRGMVYTPDAGFSGIDTFSYSFKDENGKESNEATVRVDLGAALPVSIIDFKVRKEELTSVVTWTTSAEINSERFEIERSTDGKVWYRIGEVNAADKSNTLLDYRFVDLLPESGTNYYRLKAFDHDGTFAFSRIQSVHFPEFAWARVFPNPVNDILQIFIRNKRVVKLTLVNLSGQVLFSSPIAGQTMKLDVGSYREGIYFIHLQQDNGKVGVFKIMRD